jgi:hypothetical protein
MDIKITSEAGTFTLDSVLLSEIVSESMTCFGMDAQRASALVVSIIDAQLAYSDDLSDLEDVLRGTLDFFEIYRGNLQEAYREAQFETAPF